MVPYIHPRLIRVSYFHYCCIPPRSNSPATQRLFVCSANPRPFSTHSQARISTDFVSYKPAPFQALSSVSANRIQPSFPVTPRSRFAATMATNGEARPKRRNSPISAIERPKKQLKQENGVPTPGDATPQNGSVYDIEGDANSVPIINAVSAAGDSPEWQATIEKVIKSVVSIHFCQTCSFDTDLSTSSQATGFVVDAENGYILTNRHVVCSGPF